MPVPDNPDRRKPPKKDLSIRIRCTDAQKATFEAEAQRMGLTVSSWMIYHALREANGISALFEALEQDRDHRVEALKTFLLTLSPEDRDDVLRRTLAALDPDALDAYETSG